MTAKNSTERMQMLGQAARNFLNFMEVQKKQILVSIETIDDAIQAFSESYIQLDTRKSILQIAQDFVGSLEDPRICWKYAEEIKHRVEFGFQELCKCLTHHADNLCARVSVKDPPDWLLEIFNDPQSLPKEQQEFFRVKAKELIILLGGIVN